MLLNTYLKDLATTAFRDNSKLTALSPEEREIAAQAYEQMAGGIECFSWSKPKRRPKVMFKFSEGAQVAIKIDNPVLGLSVGDYGKIWALYDTQPPAYEVTFHLQNGEEFDALMYEDELTDPIIAVETADRRLKPALVSA